MATNRHKKHRSKNTSSDLYPEEVEQAIKRLPKEDRRQVRQAIFQKGHSGPLPDADTIRVYSEVIPDGGNRLMQTVETQLKHRIESEKTADRRLLNQSSTGQWMGMFIALAFGLISWDLIRNGNEVGGTIIGSVDLVALVTVFITGRRQ